MEKEIEARFGKEPVKEPKKEKSKYDELMGLYAKAKELLGVKYDEDRVDEVIVSQSEEDLEHAFGELRESLASTKDEAEKDRFRENWLVKNNMRNRLSEWAGTSEMGEA